jgi:hypothetical protein
MDRMGVMALVIGLVLCVAGGYAIWAFSPEVIVAVKGLVGIVAVLAGLMLVIFGVLIMND